MADKQLDDRRIRLFVSSTFLDMSAERDQLSQTVFPDLQRLCRERRAGFSEIDLRWGITAEESTSGRAIALCLREVANCRPFFIGILGDRYGWVDPATDERLSAIGAEHLRPFATRSITELEIRDAVLNRPADTAKPHCFFYFRTCAEEDVPAAKETEDASRRLTELKSELYQSGVPVRAYTSPEELGELVRDDLKSVVDELFPAEVVPDAEELEHRGQIAHWEMLSRDSVGRDAEVARLKKLAKRPGTRILVTGKTGVGKSSVLAKWAETRQQGDDALKNRRGYLLRLIDLIRHLFGGQRKHSLTSGEPELIVTHSLSNLRPRDGWAGTLVQLLHRLRLASGVSLEIPDSAGSLPKVFMDALVNIGARRPLTVVLDGVEAILPEEEEGDLTWLPSTLPDSVRLVVGCTEHPATKPLLSSGWRQLNIDPLSIQDRRRVIKAFLGRYGKRLSIDQRRVIEESEACGNPLHLRTALEDLRLVGIFEQLDRRVKKQAGAKSLEELFNMVLSRLEHAFGQDRIADATSLLAVARRGLTESEMMTMLGSSGQPLPSRLWSPIYIALEYFLAVHGGTLQIRHLAFRNCIQGRYLSEKTKRNALANRLALYFASSNDMERQAEELPWHLVMSDHWEKLADCLVQRDIALAIWRRNPDELRGYWELLRRTTNITPAVRLGGVIAAPEKDLAMAELTLMLLTDLGESKAALDLSKRLIASLAHVSSVKTRLRLLGQVIAFLVGSGRFESATPLLEEQEHIARSSGNDRALIECLGNRALVEDAASNTARALELHREEEVLCRKLADSVALATCLNNQGVLYHRLGEVKQAMSLFREQIRLSRRVGDLNTLQSALGNMARIQKERGRIVDAKRLHKEEERLCRTLGNPKALAASLGNRAAILMDEGDYDQALSLIDEQEELAKRSDDPEALALVWLNRAAFFLRLRSPAAAEGYLQKAQAIIDEAGLSHLHAQLRLLEHELATASR